MQINQYNGHYDDSDFTCSSASEQDFLVLILQVHELVLQLGQLTTQQIYSS